MHSEHAGVGRAYGSGKHIRKQQIDSPFKQSYPFEIILHFAQRVCKKLVNACRVEATCAPSPDFMVCEGRNGPKSTCIRQCFTQLSSNVTSIKHTLVRVATEAAINMPHNYAVYSIYAYSSTHLAVQPPSTDKHAPVILAE